MAVWIIQGLNALSFGMLLFLLSAGLTLTFGLLRITNLTHGSYYLLGRYIGLEALRRTGNFVLALLAAGAAPQAHSRAPPWSRASGRSGRSFPPPTASSCVRSGSSPPRCCGCCSST